MHNSPGKTYKPLLDIRAPHQFRLFHLSGWQWQQGFILLLSDILALAIAWQIARY